MGIASASASSPAPPGPVSQLRADLEGMNLIASDSKENKADADNEPEGSSGAQTPPPPPPAVQIAKEKIIEEVRQKEKDGKPVLSLVVVGEYSAFRCPSALAEPRRTQVMSMLANRR